MKRYELNFIIRPQTSRELVLNYELNNNQYNLELTSALQSHWKADF